ncbi:hypothetical protein ACFQ3S_00685 [Mucilaginibacter terrae]|uniref:hypothetical protein n=1 Tax=Mucilaginibacter terrae TaxID=1955052 RepID=UPI00363325E8
MDLQKIWQSHIPSTHILHINHISDLQVKNSLNPLKKIKGRLKVSAIWCATIAIIYIAIMVYYHIWQIQALIGVALLFTVWAGSSAYRLHTQISENVTANNLLAELRRNRDVMTKWISLQNQIALFVYPFSACGGFLLGGFVGSGKSVEWFLSKPGVVWILIATITILTPLCYYLGRWMCKVAYGNLIDQLNRSITELSSTPIE